MDEQVIDVKPAPVVRQGNGWAWFFAGTTLALGLTLAGLIWALVSTGLYGQLLGRIDPRLRSFAPAVADARTSPPAPRPAAAPRPPATGAAVSPPGTPTPGGPAAGAPPASGGTEADARSGEILTSGSWKLAVNGTRREEVAGGYRRVTVDLTVKNDADTSAVLSVPATVPIAPGGRPAGRDGAPSYQPAQLADPPVLQLRVLDRAGRGFGGSFVSARGEVGGSFSFVAAPGDAIRLPYAFDLPPSSADPLQLEVRFGRAAGGGTYRVALDDTAPSVVSLLPSDRAQVNGTEQKYLVEGIWSLTLLGIDVGEPSAQGERVVTARVAAENLTGRPLPLGATLDDPSGGERDFYVVDAEARVAYSSSETMPRQPVPAGATRTVEVRMRAHRDFSAQGPHRFTIVVDPARQRYAIFRAP